MHGWEAWLGLHPQILINGQLHNFLDELTSSGSCVYNYPSLVGNISDTMTNQPTNLLLYRKFPHGLTEAKFLVTRSIEFRTFPPPILGASELQM